MGNTVICIWMHSNKLHINFSCAWSLSSKHPGLCFYDCPLVISQDLGDFAFLDIFLIQNHSSCFPEVISNHLTVGCSQEGAQETEHIAKHQRACDASAQEWELSLRGILLGSGPGPGNRVISLTKAVTGNQDSLPEDDCLNCKSAEAWPHLYFLRVIPYKTMWSFL